MTARITLLLGGARAGKSALAQQLATAGGGRVLFIATAEAGDAEMAARIARHREQRPPGWVTVEEPLHPVDALPDELFAVVVLDCMTLWVSNLLGAAASSGGDLAPAEAERVTAGILWNVAALVAAAHATPSHWILVSNEVGLGVIPSYPLGRLFRDVLGAANAQLAAAADDVALIVAGIPVVIKGSISSEGSKP